MYFFLFQFSADQITIEPRIDRPCSIEAILNLCDEKIIEITNSAAKSIENVEANYNKRIDELSQYRSEFINKINEMYEGFRNC
jgi:hypothetical protein